MKRYYLAYGSNLYTPQMRYRCPSARLMGTAVIENYKLMFKKSKTGSYLTVEPKQGAEVPVAVWQLTTEGERSIDRYEGYPKYYYKKEFQVTVTGIKTGKKRERTAFAYILDENRPSGVPSMSYVMTCLWGYRNFGFDSKQLLHAIDESKKETMI